MQSLGLSTNKQKHIHDLEVIPSIKNHLFRLEQFLFLEGRSKPNPRVFHSFIFQSVIIMKAIIKLCCLKVAAPQRINKQVLFIRVLVRWAS